MAPSSARLGAPALNLEFFDAPVLALETSCDETSVAVVKGRRVLSNIVSSQADLHAKWGGVVPEAAARAHVEAVVPVLEEALATAGIQKFGAVACTNRPGLVGALSVGVSAAKALALEAEVPLLGVHHLEGHLLSPLAQVGETPPAELPFPHVCLIVSGGHTELVWVEEPGRYRVLGETLDDAAGEAFDKGARLLGLGYPGGKAVQDAAAQGDPKRYDLPRALPHDKYTFSFSGLKTAMLRIVELEGPGINVADAAASLQEAVVDVLARKAVAAAEESGAKALSIVGGVSANRLLRDRARAECEKAGLKLYVPPFELSTDNAAMIGLVASLRLAAGERDDFSLDTLPSAPLPQPL